MPALSLPSVASAKDIDALLSRSSTPP
jgi:hypothetical protein